MNISNPNCEPFITKEELIIMSVTESGDLFITGEIIIGEDSILKNHFFDEGKKVKIDTIETLHNYIRRLV